MNLYNIWVSLFELFDDILIYWDAPVHYFGSRGSLPVHWNGCSLLKVAVSTHLPRWRCPPRSRTPGCRCCRRCCPPARCHCLDLWGQRAPSQGHVNHTPLRKHHNTPDNKYPHWLPLPNTPSDCHYQIPPLTLITKYTPTDCHYKLPLPNTPSDCHYQLPPLTVIL